MKKQLYLYAFSLFFVSCSHDSIFDESDYQYKIDIETIEDSIEWSDLVDSIDYIQLEKNENCKIGEVDHIMVNNGFIYIVSKGLLYCFDEYGKYVYSLVKGHAKNEIIEVTSANLFNNQLHVYDQFKSEVLNYDAPTGLYLNKQDVPSGFSANYSFNDVYIKDYMRVGYGGEPEGRIWISSFNNRVKKRYLKDDEHHWNIKGQKSFLKDGILFSVYYRNLAHKITSDGLSPHIILRIPKENQLQKTERLLIQPP